MNNSQQCYQHACNALRFAVKASDKETAKELSSVVERMMKEKFKAIPESANENQ